MKLIHFKEIYPAISDYLTVTYNEIYPASQIISDSYSMPDSFLNNAWLLISTALIFLMNLGFSCLEAGLIRSKNATNVLFKNMLIPVIALFVFTACGFHLMYPGNEFSGGVAGFSGFGIFESPALVPGRFNFWIFLLHQTMLATIAATIVSAAVAERIRFMSFLVFCIFFSGIIYPVAGMWYWGGGWLASLPYRFYDFAGASMVHTVGGYAALVGAAMLGPRIGKYTGSRIIPIPGHNMSVASIGLFILWFGWIGFNGGATVISGPGKIYFVIFITFIAAAAGCLGAFFISYLANRTHDITMSMNGILAGLVAISASADIMSITEALIIGLVAGLLVVFSVLLCDKLKLDDPVGAISVHLVCGTWGTLAVGVFGPLAGKEQFVSQLVGCLAIGITVSLLSFLFFFAIKKTIGLRVPERVEIEGLDLSEHGMRTYNLDSDNT